MLILMRKAGQSIDIGTIRFTVLEIVNGRVKVGIEAPGHVVRRSEVEDTGERRG